MLSSTFYRKLYRKTMRALFRYDPTFMDWHHHPIFKETGAYYLKKIFSVLEPFKDQKDTLKIVDLGCQAGRMVIPILQAGFKHVVGVDASGMGLRALSRTLRNLSLKADLQKMDLRDYVARCSSESVDVVISIETLYLCLNFKLLMKNISRILKPGGTVIATFKTKSYFFTQLVLKNELKKAHFVLDTSEGEVKDLGRNWQSQKELFRLLKTLGIECIASEFYYPFDPKKINLKEYLDCYPEDRTKMDFLDDQGQEIVIIGRKQYD